MVQQRKFGGGGDTEADDGQDDDQNEGPAQQQLPAVQQEPQEPQPDIVDYLCGLAEQYGPAIVGENTTASKLLVTIVKSAPLLKKLLAKPTDLARVLAGLDAKMGEGKVNQFLNALGVSRP
jgi:hypothetical protein